MDETWTVVHTPLRHEIARRTGRNENRLCGECRKRVEVEYLRSKKPQIELDRMGHGQPNRGAQWPR